MTLKVTHWKGVFVADHRTPEDVALLKKAGFELHEPTLCNPGRCRACRAKIGRRYWSSKVEDATKLKSCCTPAALEAMRSHLKKLQESRAVDSSIQVPAPSGLSYRPYQLAGIAYAVKRKATLNGDDMGLGKTIQALGFINYVQPKSVLILSPVTLSLNWREEAKKWLCNDYHVIVPKSSSKPIPSGIPNLMVITNYEKIIGRQAPADKIAAHLIDLAPGSHESLPGPLVDDAVLRLREKKKPKKKIVGIRCGGRIVVVKGQLDVLAMRRCEWDHVPVVVLPEGTDPNQLEDSYFYVDTPLSASLRRPWDLGIFDEAQALKNPDTQRSLNVLGPRGLYHACRRTLFLTGTPLENRPIELWPIASTLAPQRFGDWWEFARRYCGLHLEERQNRSVWVADGDSNHAELQQRLRTSIMIRRTKTQVLKELPPKCRQLVVLEDEDADWSQYPELREWRSLFEHDLSVGLSEIESARTMEEYRRAARKLKTAQIPFTQMSKFRHDTAALKLPACLRYTDEILSSGLESLVIFAHHTTDVLKKIYEHYKDDACVIFGETPPEKRMDLVSQFQAGKKRIFIGGLRAAGSGITLTRAWTVVFFEGDWNPAVLSQGEDRLCRIGQKKMVHVIHPVLDGSLDANMTKMVLAKQRVIDKIMDEAPEDSVSRLRKQRRQLVTPP